MVESLVGKGIEFSGLQKTIIKNFTENIELQGGNISSFEDIARKIKNSHTHEFKANISGFLKIDIMKMRDTIVKIQNKYVTPRNEFPDSCGIIFLKNQNENILENEVILTFRVLEDDLEYFKYELNSFIKIY
jgi:thymidine phosphorylase